VDIFLYFAFLITEEETETRSSAIAEGPRDAVC